MEQISIAGLEKWRVLQALYANAKPLGMEFLHSITGPMDDEDAKRIASDTRRGLYFDYLRGRVMKVDLSGDEFNPRLYDRDNGDGAAARAIDSIRAVSAHVDAA